MCTLTYTCMHTLSFIRSFSLPRYVCVSHSGSSQVFGLFSSLATTYIFHYFFFLVLVLFLFFFFVALYMFLWKILWCWYCHCFSTVNIMLSLYIMDIMDSASYIIIIVLFCFVFYCHYYFLFHLEQFFFVLLLLLCAGGADRFSNIMLYLFHSLSNLNRLILFASFYAIPCVYLYSLTIHKNGISLLWKRKKRKFNTNSLIHHMLFGSMVVAWFRFIALYLTEWCAQWWCVGRSSSRHKK